MVGAVLLSRGFQLAHVVEGPEQLHSGEDSKMGETWMEHERRTTSNFVHRNRLLGRNVGGLNDELEHHLFPRVCSAHAPAISRLMEATP